MHLRPLHPEFGVEVSGLDLDRITVDGAEALRAALDEHQLLVFRLGRPMSAEEHIAVTSLLGPPIDDGNGKLWSELRNVDAAGTVKLPFHSDLTYTDHPLKIISLQATEVPGGGTSTSFVSGIGAWNSLAPDLRDKLEQATLRHLHASKLVSDMPTFIADHPVRKIHPRSGRPILFVTEHHAHRILKMGEEESRQTLSNLFDHLYGEGGIYTHQWQLHDLLIWDNLAIQHARREEARPEAGARAVRRVVVNDVTYPELLERARAMERAL